MAHFLDLVELQDQLSRKRMEYARLCALGELNFHRGSEHDFHLPHYDKNASQNRRVTMAGEIQALEAKFETDMAEFRRQLMSGR